MLKAKQNNTGIKYQFGVRVPRKPKEALKLDVSKGTTYWEGVTEKEKPY